LTGNSADYGGGTHSSRLNNCILTGNSVSSYGGGAYAGALTNCILNGNLAYFGGGTYNSTLNNCTLLTNSAVAGGGAYFGTLTSCTLLSNSAASGGGANSGNLTNCTLIGNSASDSGGGAYYGALTNCTLMGNSAFYGGGADNAILKNCAVTDNSASTGGGAYSGTLFNCTLTGNRAAFEGGGTYGGYLYNCIVYYNEAPRDANNSGSAASYCCTTPISGSGTGNIDAEPQLASATHLSAVSPCRGVGSAAYASGSDIDGESWANPPSMGCDEFYAATATGTLAVAIQAAYTNVTVGYVVNFYGSITGVASSNLWSFGDGTTASNQLGASHIWSTAGDYAVILRAYNDSNPGGVSATVMVHVVMQPVHYVAFNSNGPLAPYSSWATAATNIQDAVAAVTVPGALVIVSNGVYGVGGKAVYGAMTNRVAVTMPLILRSVNGPSATIIQGYQMPGTTNGDAAVRCVYLTNGSTLIGFTLTNGATRASGDEDQEQSGGGVWCVSVSVVVSNCVLAGNAACLYGGGAHYGQLNSCILADNVSGRSGGGFSYGNLKNCTLTNNSTFISGGGAYSAILNDCILVGNEVSSGGVYSSDGGGAFLGALTNCTLIGNSASSWAVERVPLLSTVV